MLDEVTEDEALDGLLEEFLSGFLHYFKNIIINTLTAETSNQSQLLALTGVDSWIAKLS